MRVDAPCRELCQEWPDLWVAGPVGGDHGVLDLDVGGQRISHEVRAVEEEQAVDVSAGDVSIPGDDRIAPAGERGLAEWHGEAGSSGPLRA